MKHRWQKTQKRFVKQFVIQKCVVVGLDRR